MTDPVIPKQRRGLACLSPERRAEISRKGGAAVKAKNRAFSKNRELARAAGRLGGLAIQEIQRAADAAKEPKE